MTQRASVLLCDTSLVLEWIVLAVASTAGVRSATRPPSSLWLSSAVACASHGSACPIVGSTCSIPGRIAFANAFVGPNEASSEVRARLVVRSSGGSAAIVALRSFCLAASADSVESKRGYEARELALARGQRSEHVLVALHVPAEVVRLGAEQCLVDDRGRLERAGGVLERLVQRLSGGQAPDTRVLRGVLRRGRLAVERGADALQERLEVAAGVGVQRVQDAIELHRARRARRRQGVAGIQHRSVRGTGVQIDVEVPLEEDPGQDPGGRVRVNRQAVRVDVHRDHRGARVAPEQLDRGHLADVDPRDPDRRGDVQLGLGREHGLEHERRAAERRRAAEHQVDRGRDHERGDDPGDEVRDPGTLAPHFLPPLPLVLLLPVPVWLVCSVWRPWLPGTFPISAAAPEYGSFPASHSAGWPGELVFGYGLR